MTDVREILGHWIEESDLGIPVGTLKELVGEGPVPGELADQLPRHIRDVLRDAEMWVVNNDAAEPVPSTWEEAAAVIRLALRSKEFEGAVTFEEVAEVLKAQPG